MCFTKIVKRLREIASSYRTTGNENTLIQINGWSYIIITQFKIWEIQIDDVGKRIPINVNTFICLSSTLVTFCIKKTSFMQQICKRWFKICNINEPIPIQYQLILHIIYQWLTTYESRFSVTWKVFQYALCNDKWYKRYYL